MFRRAKPTFAVSAAAAMIAALGWATPAAAGDGNTIYIQQNSVSGLTNSLEIDQSNATNSLVAGDTAGTTPALQSGGNNTGDITLSGDGATVLFSQTNSGIGNALNTANITGGALATIVLQQDGYGNTGTLDVGSGGNQGALFQYGHGNDGTVKVSGSKSSGTLYQKGDSNSYSLEVTGSGTTVQWNQIGSNITAASVTPAQVISNAGTVSITQSSF